MQHDRGATVRGVLSAVSGLCPAVSEYSVSVETRNRILPSPSIELCCQQPAAGANMSECHSWSHFQQCCRGTAVLQCPHRLQSGRDLHDWRLCVVAVNLNQCSTRDTRVEIHWYSQFLLLSSLPVLVVRSSLHVTCGHSSSLVCAIMTSNNNIQ